MFPPRDIVRGKLKSRAKGPSKFQSEWSAPHKAVSIIGVIIILKTINSNCKIVFHHDRIFLGKNFSSRELELTLNFQGDKQDPEWGSLLVKQFKEALMRTRQGPLIKPN